MSNSVLNKMKCKMNLSSPSVIPLKSLQCVYLDVSSGPTSNSHTTASVYTHPDTHTHMHASSALSTTFLRLDKPFIDAYGASSAGVELPLFETSAHCAQNCLYVCVHVCVHLCVLQTQPGVWSQSQTHHSQYTVMFPSFTFSTSLFFPPSSISLILHFHRWTLLFETSTAETNFVKMSLMKPQISTQISFDDLAIKPFCT